LTGIDLVLGPLRPKPKGAKVKILEIGPLHMFLEKGFE
jgi:hypothetical protein